MCFLSGVASKTVKWLHNSNDIKDWWEKGIWPPYTLALIPGTYPKWVREQRKLCLQWDKGAMCPGLYFMPMFPNHKIMLKLCLVSLIGSWNPQPQLPAGQPSLTSFPLILPSPFSDWRCPLQRSLTKNARLCHPWIYQTTQRHTPPSYSLSCSDNRKNKKQKQAKHSFSAIVWPG